MRKRNKQAREMAIVRETARTLIGVADELEAGRLDPGTPGRTAFIADARRLQAHLEQNSVWALAALGLAFSNPGMAQATVGMASASAAQAKDGD